MSPMRTLLAAALLLVSAVAAGEDAPKPLSITVESIGDRDDGIVARVFFRFANPHGITDAGLFIEGSFTQGGHVPRNFRLAVPRKDDKLVWNNMTLRNGKIIRNTRWSVLPDQRNEMTMLHTFAEGEAEIDVRLVLEADYEGQPQIVAAATETFTLVKTNRPLPPEPEQVTPEISEEAVPETTGAVTMLAPHRTDGSSLSVVGVDVLPPVKRVEFWVENKKVLVRNAPPYTAELDLGDSPEGLALRAIGYDAAGHYVDADTFVGGADPLAVKVLRVVTTDGLSHFKLSVRKPKGTRLKRIALYAGEKKLQEWDGPPFALSVPESSLAGVDSVRASVLDEAGHEATDLLLVRAVLVSQ